MPVRTGNVSRVMRSYRVGGHGQEGTEQNEHSIGDRVTAADPAYGKHDQDVAGGEQDGVAGGAGDGAEATPAEAGADGHGEVGIAAAHPTARGEDGDEV